MTICIPINEDKGLKSELCLHFTTAPNFMIIDPSTLQLNVIDNEGIGTAQPVDELVALLSEYAVSSAVVGGINPVVLRELQRVGISVFSSARDNVDDIVAAFTAGDVTPVTLDSHCSNRHTGRGFRGFGCSSSRGHSGCRGQGD